MVSHSDNPVRSHPHDAVRLGSAALSVHDTGNMTRPAGNHSSSGDDSIPRRLRDHIAGLRGPRDRTRKRIAVLGFVAALAASAPATAADRCRWQASWGSSQMVPDGNNALPADALNNATLRQVVRASIGGRQMRIRLSNAFGRTPMLVAGASVARSAGNTGGGVVEASVRPLRFAGRSDVAIPPGAEWVSDPVDFPVAAFDDLAVTLQLTAADGRTSHPGSRATSYLAVGNRGSDVDLGDAKRTTHWFQLSGLEVVRCGVAPDGIVALGDSITDGYGVASDTNMRWTDALARRLGGKIGVINQGIGGNRLLGDGLGPSALARLDRDVLALPGIGHLILLEGVNDLGGLARAATATPEHHVDMVRRITSAYAQIVARARARGITVHGATITPFMGSGYYKPDAAIEADRQAINAWLRTPGNVDHLIDFDRALADPARPGYLAAQFDNDGLHPSIAGYTAMAQAVDLSWFGVSSPVPAGSRALGPRRGR